MILISPAKRLQTESFDSSLNSTKPLFAKEADLIASELKKLDISCLLYTSPSPRD